MFIKQLEIIVYGTYNKLVTGVHEPTKGPHIVAFPPCQA